MKLYLIKCDTKHFKNHTYDILNTREEAEKELWEAENIFPLDYNFRIEEIEVIK